MGRRQTTRYGIGAIAAVVVAATAVGVGASVQALPGPTPSQVLAIEVGDGTMPVGVLGSAPSVSGDGRFVAFESSVPDQSSDGVRSTVFVTDRTDASTIEVSPLAAGLRPGDTVAPVLSADGCVLAAVTELAHDRFRDDDAGLRWDVYRTRLPHCGGEIGNWDLVSVRPDGSGLARDDVTVGAPTINRPGTLLAYTHPATQLAAADPATGHGLTAISLVDLTVPVGESGHTATAPGLPVVLPATTFVHAGLDQPALSGDGRFLAFRSDASSDRAVAEWHTGPAPGEAAVRQVYVWDREQADPFAAVRLVSQTPDGAPVGDGAASPVLSNDGRVVVYTSRDQGIVDAEFAPCRDVCPAQVYRLDRDADGDAEFDEEGDRRTTIVSARPGDGRPVAGTSSSTQPAIDERGQIVAFVSRAANFDPLVQPVEAEDGTGDIFVADVVTGAFDRVRDDEVSSSAIRGRHSRPHVSDTGRTLVFDTAAPAEMLDEDLPEETVARHVVARSSPPRLTLSDADLGTTRVGLESDEWYVAVVNDGPSAFRPASVTIGDPHFAINPEGSTCMLDVTVPPGGDCVIKVSFTPTEQAPYSTTLTVAEEGFDAVSITAAVSGAGGEPALRSLPAGADLGTVDVGVASVPYLFDIANVSQFATSIGNVAISGAHAADFSVTSNSCANRPLNPDATCAIGITFTPDGAGRRSALLEITTPEGQYTSAVLGGVGRFEPQLAVWTDEVIAGRDVVVIGSGYRPNAVVTLSLGEGEERTVTASHDGGFMLWVPVDPYAPAGRASLVATSPDGTNVSDPVEVIPQAPLMIRVPGFGLG